MLQTRVIPIMLLKNRGFYKGVQFKSHRYVGDPINTVKIFNDKEVDELIILDIGSNNRPDFEYLEKISKEAFMPMCYGGGIKTLEDAKKIFSLGFEKISLNTLFFHNTYEIEKIIKYFGSQSVVLSLDIKKNLFGRYKCYFKNTKEKSTLSIEAIIDKIDKIGFGEVLLTSINNEGKMCGYDFILVEKFQKKLSMPIIVNGGAKSFSDFEKAQHLNIHAVAASSMFVFHGIHNAVLITYKSFYTHKKSREI